MIHKTLHNLDGYRQTDSLSKAGPAEVGHLGIEQQESIGA